MSDELVTVATFRFAPPADLARALLEQEGITAFVADENLVTTNWFLGGAVGHVKLQVPATQVEAARALLDRHPQVLDETPPGETSDDEAAANEAVDDEGSMRCLACGATMAEKEPQCSACGWSYAAVDPTSETPGDSAGA